MLRKYSPLLVAILIFSWVISDIFKTQFDGYDFKYASSLPVLHNGRLKPMDSVVRHTLVSLHEKQSLTVEGKSYAPNIWFFEMITNQDKPDRYAFFRFLNPDKVMPQFLGLNQSKKSYSFLEMKPALPIVFENYDKAKSIPSKQQSPFQRDVVTLANRLIVYQQAKLTLFPETKSYETYLNEYYKGIPSNIALFTKYQKHDHVSDVEFMALSAFNSQFKLHQWLNQNALFFPIPVSLTTVSDPHAWQSVGLGMLSLLNQKNDSLLYLQHYAKMLDAFKSNDPMTFKSESKSLYDMIYQSSPWLIRKMEFERAYNSISPFYKSAVLYLICFILIFVSLILKSNLVYTNSLVLFWGGFILHTFGILSRMFLQGRPPVTNLYSSAVFIGWAAILIALFLEKFFKNKMGILVSCVVGFATLIVAHYLSLSGDTLEMMQAVLDTNFWLSTHVVTVTMGYSGTFLAGVLAIVYVIRLVFLSNFPDSDKKELAKMIYGILCFSLFFSFVGTVLGGIWADQSWGRFWGWY